MSKLKKEDAFVEETMSNGSKVTIIKLKGIHAFHLQMQGYSGFEFTNRLIARAIYIDGKNITYEQFGEFDCADYIRMIDVVGAMLGTNHVDLLK